MRTSRAERRLLRLRRLAVEPLEARRVLSGVLFVDAYAASGGAGASWDDAFVSLQTALDRAAELNTDADAENDIADVWIAAGTYRPSRQSVDDTPRTERFELIEGVSLRGGFAGTETTPDDRPLAGDGSFANETILSGDLEANDQPDDPASYDDNAYTVVYVGESVEEALLDGLTITAGRADGEWDEPYLEPGYGGGIYAAGPLTLINSVVSDNTAAHGGGIYTLATLTISDSTVAENRAIRPPGVLASLGGGIFNEGELIVINATVSDNPAATHGGGIANMAPEASMTMVGSAVSGNSATYGGGIWFGSVGTSAPLELVIDRSTITGNVAQEIGGGVFTSRPTRITNTTVFGNLAELQGGGIFVHKNGTTFVANSAVAGNGAGREGGGLSNEGDLTLVNSALAANAAPDGRGGGIFSTGDLTASNCIVALNRASEAPNVDGEMTPESGRNLIGIDPRFVRNPGPGADATWGTEDDDYGDLRLTESSRAINTGDNAAVPPELTTDLDGKPRIYGPRVDLGAYELQRPGDPGGGTPATLVTFAEDILDPSDGETSLREAIFAADDGDRVTFGPWLDGRTIVLGGEPLLLDRAITVDASALESLVIDADGKSRVMEASGDGVELIGLTISGGNAGEDDGGGIHNTGGLTVSHSTITDNSADLGGGVYSSGTITIRDSVITDNSGHGIYNLDGRLTLTNSTVVRNSNSGIRNKSGIATITDSTIAENSTTFEGGGINSSGGELAVTRSTVERNLARDVGGGLYIARSQAAITESAIAGNSSTSNRGGGIYNAGTLTIASSTVSGNSAAASGGGIYNHRSEGALTVTNSTIARNSASAGGGIYTRGIATITNSTLLRNSVRAGSGGGDRRQRRHNHARKLHRGAKRRGRFRVGDRWFAYRPERPQPDWHLGSPNSEAGTTHSRRHG